MSGQPRAAEWEYLVEGDLAPHLVPRPRPGRSGRGAVGPRLPDGAPEGIAASLGPVRTEALLVIPAAAWPLGGWRRRCLYSPLCVAAIGEQTVGLWVRDLPLPGVRTRIALDDIALIAHRSAGPWHALTVTARTGRLVIRYGDDQRVLVEAWTSRLRRHLASAGVAASPGSSAAVAPAELIIEQSGRVWYRPWRQVSETICLPRQTAGGVVARGKTLRLESAGTAVRVRLASRKTAAAASKWLASPSCAGPRGAEALAG